MTIQEFRDYMASGKPVIGGSDVHMIFPQLSQEALFLRFIPIAVRTRSFVNGCSSMLPSISVRMYG